MKNIFVVLSLLLMFVGAQPIAAIESETSEQQAEFELAIDLIGDIYSADEIRTNRDAHRGFSILKKLARQGHRDSLDKLISHYGDPFYGGDYYETIVWLTESYRHGNVYDMVQLGAFYAKDFDRYGNNWSYNLAETTSEKIEASFPGIQKDLEKAFACYQLAANNKTDPNNVRGMIFFGEAYSKGEGTSIDHAKAVFWLEEGLSLLSEDDQNRRFLEFYGDQIGLLKSYYRGQIYPSFKNTSKEIYWGDEYIYFFVDFVTVHSLIGHYYVMGTRGRVVDIDKARRFFSREAVQEGVNDLNSLSESVAVSCQMLGAMYLFGGKNLEPDYAKGKRYLQRALENGASPDDITHIEKLYARWQQ